jgi:hypothetical protein
MQEALEKARKVKSQIAFFVLLCIALLLGMLLMISISGTRLSKPIELGYAGLSVSMPTGVQWDSQQQWKYGDNNFYLTSILRNSEGRTSGSVQCRYLLESTDFTPEDLFSQKTSEISGEIISSGDITKGLITIQWVGIGIPASSYEIYYGISKLSNNHLIEIEVQKVKVDLNTAELFEDIIKSLRLEQTPPVQTGIDTIQEIKNKGADSFLNGIDSPIAFLIMDSAGKPLGFTLDVFVHSKANKPLTFEAEGLYYLREPFSHWESVSFYGDESIAEYVWRSERLTSSGKREVQMILDKDGTITMTELSVPPSEKKFEPSISSIPEVFADILFSHILESEREQVNVEFIESSGKITPVAILKIEPAITRPDWAKPAYALQMDFLDDSGRTQKIFFDEAGKSIRETLIIPVKSRGFLTTSGNREVLTMVRSSAENLVTQFPEQAEGILQKISKADLN